MLRQELVHFHYHFLPPSMNRHTLIRITLCTSALWSFAAADHAAADPSVYQRIKPGARGVQMLSYPLEKDCKSTAQVRSMTLVYDGSSSKDIRSLIAKVDGKQIAKKQSIDPEDLTAHFTFTHKTAPRVCGGASVDIFADFARSAAPGSKHQLIVELVSDVFTTKGESIGVTQRGPLIEIRRKGR